MSIKSHYELVVIGAGPAGMAAASAAHACGLKSILVLDRNDYVGGILPQCIHDGFGLYLYKKSFTGPEYAALWKEKLFKKGIEVHTSATVLKVEYNKQLTLFYLGKELGSGIVTADSIVFAMGCRERSLGQMRIPGSRPAGIYTAGTAQYMMNIQNYLPGKSVVILGSGDIGLIMARRMTLEGANIKLILGERASGLVRNHVQCVKDFDIPVLYGWTLLSTHGYKRLKGVTIAPIDENGNKISEQKKYIPCDTLLVAAGLIPETELWKGAHIALDENKGIRVTETGETDIPGVFACGNVVRIYDVVDMVSLSGERAGMAAAKWVIGQNHGQFTIPNELSKAQTIRINEPRGIGSHETCPDEIICILCPTGCRMRISGKEKEIQVSGYSCEKGKKYAVEELTMPMRTLTTTVLIKGGVRPLLPVRTDHPIPQKMMGQIIERCRGIKVTAPVSIGEIIEENVANSGACLIASDSIALVKEQNNDR
jgi:CxxC motif-containing protein/NADPH-dependent 2,4-dienoyl-CoA reductase/sulfur reductase-like enzyme